jgi:signal peptidase I
MAPTLIKGDHIMVKRRDPIERGAVMVFKDLATSSGEGTADVVKRVVAVSGDLVAVRSGHVILNGAAINEPYLDYETETGIDFGPVTVPREAVFILGDNRGHSFDSRYYEVPFVPTSAALGKVLFVYFSAHDTGRIGLQVR